MRIGEILVRQGMVTPADVEAATVRQRLRGGPLGANLIALERLTVDQLVAVLQDQRDLATLPVCERQLTNWEISFGPNHPNTSRARYSLARLRLAAGDPATALELGQTALAIQKTVLGPDHPWTRDTVRLNAAATTALDRVGKETASVA
jgi:hypothetical protein